jgi:hypothetical protein
LTRKAVELALVGDPTAMRLCIERILPQCRERTVKFRLAADRECSRYRGGDESGHLALASSMITPGEEATIAAVVDTFVRAIETSDFERLSSWSRPAAPTTRTVQPACTAAARVSASTLRRDLAADSLQMAGSVIVYAIRNCGAPFPGWVY